jgi:hypothetical protein
MKGKYGRKIALGFLFGLGALFVFSKLYFSTSIITFENELTKESTVNRPGRIEPIGPPIANRQHSHQNSILTENNFNDAESSTSNSEKNGFAEQKNELVKASNLSNVSEVVFAITGAAPQDYKLGLDMSMTFNGEPSIYLGSKSNNPKAYGAAIHHLKPVKCHLR